MLNIEQSAFLLIDCQTKLLPTINKHKILIEKLKWICSVVNDLDILSIISEQYPKGLGGSDEELLNSLNSKTIMAKTFFSAMRDKNIADTIDKSTARQWVIAGIEAHVCVLQTALDMHASGKDTYVLSDAIGSRDPQDKELAIERMRQAGIKIISCEMAFFEWLQGANNPLFKSMSKKFLQ